MTNAEILAAEVVLGELVPSEINSIIVPWWSFTKTALAAGALALVRDGRLQLDKKLGDKPYTLTQVLQHTSGLPDYGVFEEYHNAIERGDTPWPLSEMLERVNTDKLLFKPGTRFSYSNVGYALVRQEIEEVTKETIGSVLQNMVFGPLKVEGVRIAKSSNDMDTILGGNTRKYNPAWLYHGLLLGPISSATLFLDRLMTGDLLPQSLKNEMLDPIAINGDISGRPFKNPTYGLGVIMGFSKAGHCIGHTGQGPGSTIAVYHFIEQTLPCTKAAFILQDGYEHQGMLEQHISNF